MDTLGTHLLIEYRTCDQKRLNDVEFVEEALRKAAKAANTTVVGAAFHRYKPIGVSGILLVAESHLSIHTWPEEAYAAVDIYTCGDCNTLLAHDVLAQCLGAEHFEIMRLSRGRPSSHGIKIVEHNTSEENPLPIQSRHAPAVIDIR